MCFGRTPFGWIYVGSCNESPNSGSYASGWIHAAASEGAEIDELRTTYGFDIKKRGLRATGADHRPKRSFGGELSRTISPTWPTPQRAKMGSLV